MWRHLSECICSRKSVKIVAILQFLSGRREEAWKIGHFTPQANARNRYYTDTHARALVLAHSCLRSRELQFALTVLTRQYFSCQSPHNNRDDQAVNFALQRGKLPCALLEIFVPYLFRGIFQRIHAGTSLSPDYYQTNVHYLISIDFTMILEPLPIFPFVKKQCKYQSLDNLRMNRWTEKNSLV